MPLAALPLVGGRLAIKQEVPMGASASLFLIAVGAIVAFAITEVFEGIDLVAAGWILMFVGTLGLVLSIFNWETWGGIRRTSRTTVREAPAQTRVVYREDDVLR